MNHKLLVFLCVVTVGFGLVTWQGDDVSKSAKMSHNDNADDSPSSIRKLSSADSELLKDLPLNEGGLSLVRAVKAGPDSLEDYAEWGSTPDRPVQSIGPDIDPEDLSVLDERSFESVGLELDIEDLAVLELADYQDVGADIDAESQGAYDATVKPQSVGGDADPVFVEE